jgi:dihydropyrimidine dehydrogenase (NADP+)
LISEKRARYWVEGSKQIRKEFPNKVLIGSVMAPAIKEDWEQLTEYCNEAGFQLIELNLSCNHGMPDKGMGKACSDDPAIVGLITKWVVSKAKMPVFIKLSPNSSINAAAAKKVKENGGIGITTTNTMYSLMDPTGDGLPWPKVGKENYTYFGGAAGAVLRPIALRVATEMSQLNLGLEQMATGGIHSGEHAMWYNMYGGCSVFQVCSAVQEQDFAIISDLSTGLKASIYSMARSDLISKGWKGQSPPVDKIQKLKHFNNTFSLWEKDEKPLSIDVTKLPKLKDLRSKGQERIEHITSMDIKAQQFPFIDNDLCVNCGKCYLTCLDSGYQAIQFDSKTHKPEITKDCTGCGLCYAVCPVPGALIFKDRPYPYQPVRGDDYFEPKL